MDEYVKKLIDKKAIRYIEVDSEQYVETGEIVTKGLPIKRDDLVAGLVDKAPNTGFSIFRDTIMFRMLDNLGAKGKVMSYLIRHNSIDNLQTTTIKDISKKAGVSIQTVSDCLKMLEEIGVISVSNEYCKKDIFLNPGIAHRGNRYREKVLMEAFEEHCKEVKKKHKEEKKKKKDV